ncbi:MAG TPA: DUF6702 family protein [Puia sp.]|jgi:hypothetical protein|nr:DUF6702 family protein [Puia sp.]
MAGYLFKWLSAAGLCFTLAGWGKVEGKGPGKAVGEPHPLYISVTEINHNPKDKILEVSCKVFTNDFESVLEKMARTHVDLSSAGDKTASGRLIEAYVVKHLRLKVDGKPVALHFIGSENENDGTWSYFQVNDITALKRIDVSDDLLYDGFSQQINILHVTVGGERKSTRLDCPEANAVFEF